MTQTPESIARDYIDGQKPHSRLDSWLKGREIDKAMKAMNISAVAKKPGRVTKRVGKELSNLFEAPHVVQWDKGMKVVYAPSFTEEKLGTVLRDEAFKDLPDARAIFQTDLYFRSNDEVTEVNASTISAITESAMRSLIEKGDFNHESGGLQTKKALTRARIFQTGLPESDIDPEDIRQFLIPQGDLALVAISMPIDRVEFDEEKTGQVVVIVGVLGRDDLSTEEIAKLDSLAHAMTREGHPGAEAFSALVSAQAGPVDSASFAI